MQVTVQPKNKDSAGTKTLMVKKWFQSLSLQEQSVAVTVIDRDLVNLFKAMYKVYENTGHQGGNFTAKLDHCDSVHKADVYKKVVNYQLLYQKRSTQLLRSDYM